MGVALFLRDEHGFLQPIELKSKACNEVQKNNSALSQIFTSTDLSDLYARWYHKLADFEGMSIKHQAGHKLYCTDALSRR